VGRALVRQLVGERHRRGTVVTPDDLPNPAVEPDIAWHALWEIGLAPESALAWQAHIATAAARAAKLATLVVTTG